MNLSTSTRPTVPAPMPVTPELAAYVRASEHVRQALAEQRECTERLRALDSSHPVVSL